MVERNALKRTTNEGAQNKKANDRLDTLFRQYKKMLEIRRFEEKSGQLYGMGLIGGFCHLYIGQEAVVVGVQDALVAGDQIITSYRDHGHMIACNMDADGMMAELTGRIGGYSKGKGGSMHMFSVKKGFYGGHGIVGAQIPIGAGLAFSNKYRGNKHLTATYCGDGAINQGQVYETFNMAALWSLPVMFVVENNMYGMGTSVARASANSEDLHRRGEAYGIPGMAVNGMDVEEVATAAQEAATHIRAGKGPIILEMKTYRYRGHSMSDPAKYRTKQEVDEVRNHSDPIEHVREILLASRSFSAETLKAVDKDIKAVVSKAASFAQESPEPDSEELYTDIFHDA
ncbi:MAG: pyruvate dehydrogenase (acetyl-transferring) E1 component subunit alpha [Alphaproteobacteria bacterium]|nr:pyruvate dehydrogenase (acetyl-transferring) E1 component subunit alpha [Alphaproteobacteria bacterium]